MLLRLLLVLLLVVTAGSASAALCAGHAAHPAVGMPAPQAHVPQVPHALADGACNCAAHVALPATPAGGALPAPASPVVPLAAGPVPSGRTIAPYTPPPIA